MREAQGRPGLCRLAATVTEAYAPGVVLIREEEPQRPATSRKPEFLRIRDLPEALRPRERLLEYGPASLSESELLAILLGTGDVRRSAVGLAEDLLTRFAQEEEPTGLRGLSAVCASELCEVAGVGPAKAARLLAAFELGRRLSSAQTAERPVIREAEDGYRLLAPRLSGLDREHFVAVLLNSKHHVIAIERIAIGTLNATLVHPRELFKDAIRKSAASLLLAHNHPSGDPTPSPEDRDLTQQLLAAGEILGIRILDHLVIGDGRYTSLRRSTRLWEEYLFHR